jgi:DNA-binding XRE family transcriptional regulator
MMPDPMPDIRAMNLQRLTSGEELWLWRTRGQTAHAGNHGRKLRGVSQFEAAANIGVSIYGYQQIEQDKKSPSKGIKDMIRSTLSPLTRYECCLLARRRAAMAVDDLARAIGVTDTRVLEIEREADVRIIALWKEKGFFGFPG